MILPLEFFLFMQGAGMVVGLVWIIFFSWIKY